MAFRVSITKTYKSDPSNVRGHERQVIGCVRFESLTFCPHSRTFHIFSHMFGRLYVIGGEEEREKKELKKKKVVRDGVTSYVTGRVRKLSYHLHI